MEHEHTPEAIRRRLASEAQPSYLRDWVLGGIDGGVTTFAVVSGVTGAQLAPGIVLILGFANLLADGLSMAAGNLLGTRAERDERRQREAMEHRHIDAFPEGEREEIRQIFRGKGLDGEVLEAVTERITADRERWVRTMLTEEHGLPRRARSPWRAALATLGAFVACGLVPLIPYLLASSRPFPLAAAGTGAAFLAIGSLRSRWSVRPWWRSGLETLAVGSAAAAVAFAVGVLLRGLA
jgi:VIT1/CCC1 family predicted Fe2+/Mn2+ transporter